MLSSLFSRKLAPIDMRRRILFWLVRAGLRGERSSGRPDRDAWSMIRLGEWHFWLKLAVIVIAMHLWPADSMAHGIHRHTESTILMNHGTTNSILALTAPQAQNPAQVKAAFVASAVHDWYSGVIACLGGCCGITGTTCCVTGIVLEPPEIPPLTNSCWTPIERMNGAWGFESHRLCRPPKSLV